MDILRPLWCLEWDFVMGCQGGIVVDGVEVYEQYLHDTYTIGVTSEIQSGSRVLRMKTCSVREQLENAAHCGLMTGTP